MNGSAAAAPSNHPKNVVDDEVADALKRNGIEVHKLMGTGAFSEVSEGCVYRVMCAILTSASEGERM